MKTGMLTVAAAISFVFLLSGCSGETPAAGRAAPKPPEDTLPQIEIDSNVYRVSGPHVHENLGVYLLHSAGQDPREFITLDEGLQDGSVIVSEKQNEQVNELIIENTNSLPLFLHEGDRLSGGKQDRTIYSSFVVASKSGKMPLPAFCIESARWQANSGDSNANYFQNTSNVALASKSVRAAAKIGNSQDEVWKKVKMEKEQAQAALSASNTNSSLNETFDDPKVREVSDSYSKALEDVVKKNPDAAGVAIVINGTIEEVNVYPNNKLLAKLYPRLLQSYAVQAAVQKKDANGRKNPEAGAIAQFIRDGKEKSKRDSQINSDNLLAVQEFEILDSHIKDAKPSKKFECSTSYGGKVVHWQTLNNVEKLKAPRDRQTNDSTFTIADQD